MQESLKALLGPLLFLVYINDLDPSIKSQHFFFADDTQMYQAQLSETEQVYRLNLDLKEILKWANKWMVQFAPEKTIYLRIAKKKPPETADYQTYGTTAKLRFANTHIQRSKTHRVLGVIFEHNLRFNEQSKKVLTNLQKRLFLLRRFIFYNPKLSVKIKLVLGYAFILSQLRSFLFVWHPHNNYNSLVTVYHEAMKLILGARKFTPISTLYTLTGWLSLKDTIFVQTFKILSKLQVLRDDHPLKKEINLDEVLTNLHTKKHPTLYHKQIVNRYHEYEINDYNLKIHHKFTKDYLEETVRAQHIEIKIPNQVEKLQRENPRSGTTIRRFNEYAQSPHFYKATQKLYRLPGDKSKPIIQLMTGWSWLNNTGKRYQILPESNCPICKQPEDVKHYLFECTAFSEQRQLLKHDLRNLNQPFTEKTLFGLRNLSSKQLYSIFLSLFDYVSNTKRKKIGYSQSIERWNKILQEK